MLETTGAEIGTLLHCWWECKLVQPLWKIVWRFLKDLEIEIPFDPAIPFLGIYPKDYKLLCYKDTCTCMFTACMYNSKDLEPTQMPINDRLNKENMAHIHHGILCSHKKRMSSCLCRDMDESGNHHSQQTDTRAENQTPHVLTHKWVLNNEDTWAQGGEQHTLEPVGKVRGLGRDSRGWGGWGGITLGEIHNVDDRGMEAAIHHGMCIPMQQSYKICTCTPEIKSIWKKKSSNPIQYPFLVLHK